MKKIILALLIIGQIFLNANQSDKELINSPELDSKTNEQMQILSKFVDYSRPVQSDLRYDKLSKKLANNEINIVEFDKAVENLKVETTKDFYDSLEYFTEISIERPSPRGVYFSIDTDNTNELPSEICMLSNLETIDVREANITDLPPCVVNLTKLSILNLRKTQIKEITEIISKIPNLKALNLSYSKIENLGKHILNMKNLEALDISGTDISEISPEFGNLTGLKQFNCDMCRKLKSIPDEMANLKNLQLLNLSLIAQKEFPKWITNLQNLEYLSTSFENFPQNFSNLQNLKILSISNVSQENFMEILKLHNLEDLQLNDSNITTIPDEIENLANLKRFEYTRGSLKTISPKIANLKNLETLLIYDNKDLSALPENIGELTKLRDLNIGFTGITKLPSSIVNLKNLFHIDILDLPIQNQEILQEMPNLKIITKR
ncbi:hypothetical protein OFO03_03740 [Campylobacter sp. JMF_02 ED1]|uniref:leucine-rich repeat domain-containing protein n=1 Tax=unclassified Campylobacter TaxID=2593542 RepID=UPI0022E9C2AD|nr:MULTISPECIES: hypothetical protein [unclassified Campylobacter]MDA3050048.1 hypothetical protein [Campylobacter sp. JMF_15 NE4]MDA3051006.1 hypothetical protein [Campylobacter sp. JMF_02 ED1]